MDTALHEYRARVRAFDFSYDRSDDHRVWQKGHDEYMAICVMARRVDPDFKIFNAIKAEVLAAPRH